MSLSPYDFMQDNESNIDGAGYSTTPAPNTNQNGQRVLVDWVSASFERANSIEKVYRLLGIENQEGLEIKEGARYENAGYNKTYLIGQIELMQHEKPNQFLLNLSGEGCRQYELITGKSMAELIINLSNLDASFNRLDIAIDDFDNIYSTRTIRNAVYNKRCVTSLRDWGNMQKGKITSGNDFLTMDSFYLGSRKGRYFLNIYDKKLEREDKGKGEEVAAKTWTRTEIRFSYEYAEKFADYITLDPNNLGKHIKGFLSSKFIFLTPSSIKKDSNKSRLAKDKKNHARWWTKFIGNVAKLDITTDKVEKTLYDTELWHNRQVATSMAQMYLYHGDDFNKYIEDVKNEGLTKMQSKHYAMVNNQLYLDGIIKNKTEKKEPQNEIQ